MLFAPREKLLPVKYLSWHVWEGDKARIQGLGPGPGLVFPGHGGVLEAVRVPGVEGVAMARHANGFNAAEPHAHERLP